MDDQEISVDPRGKLELTEPDDAFDAVDPRHTLRSKTGGRADRASIRHARKERLIQEEAERSLAAEASERASSAEPPERGAETGEEVERFEHM